MLCLECLRWADQCLNSSIWKVMFAAQASESSCDFVKLGVSDNTVHESGNWCTFKRNIALGGEPGTFTSFSSKLQPPAKRARHWCSHTQITSLVFVIQTNEFVISQDLFLPMWHPRVNVCHGRRLLQHRIGNLIHHCQSWISASRLVCLILCHVCLNLGGAVIAQQ